VIGCATSSRKVYLANIPPDFLSLTPIVVFLRFPRPPKPPVPEGFTAGKMQLFSLLLL
jgi:hypothetical protein